MTAPRRILVVNPNTNRAVTGWLAAEARRVAAATTAIDAVNADSGLAAIATPDDIARASAAVVIAATARPAPDGIVVGAFGDPGLEAVREACPVPVAGLGFSGLRAAARGGRRFAVVTLGAAMEQPIRARIAALGLDDGLASLSILPASIGAFIESRSAWTAPLLAVVARCFEDHGAQAVLLGGAPFAGLAHVLADRTGRPVLDGVAASLAALGCDIGVGGRTRPD